MNLIAGQSYCINFLVANGNVLNASFDSENEPKDSVVIMKKVDLEPIMKRLEKRLERLEIGFGDIVIMVTTDKNGQIIDGGITIRSGQND